MKFIEHFSKLSRASANIAGGKGASLGEMLSSEFPIPLGFVILANTFDNFLKKENLGQKIRTILDTVDIKNIQSVSEAGEKIQKLILLSKISKETAEQIKKEFKKLKCTYVAVRSSATAEDGLGHAWAGQLNSYLNTTQNNLLENIKKCWASLYTPRAIFYRLEKGLDTTHIGVAVIVQKMIESEKSGIAFSVHPVTEDPNQMIIEAGFGLGDKIVAGEITPDSYVVSKKDNEIIDININCKKQILNEKQILELAKLIKKIEKHYGVPQDIEWAYADNKFWITQSRPITTLNTNDTSPQSNSYNPNNKETQRYKLHWAQSDFDLTSLDILCRESIYSELDYTIICEDNIQRAYIQPIGIENARKISMRLLDSVFTKKILDKQGDLNARLQRYSISALTETNILDEWTKFTQLVCDFFDVYAFSDQPFLQELEDHILNNERITKSKLIDILTKHEIPHKTELTEDGKDVLQSLMNLGTMKLTLHESAEALFRDGVSAIFSFVENTYGLTHKQTMVLLKHEFETLLSDGKIDLNILELRLNGYALLRDRNNEWVCIVDEKYEKLKNNISKHQPKTIKGSIAFKGVAEGVVVKHMSWTDTIEIPDRAVLVTGMTNPQMIPFIKKASAIITDEGGITCHAAIIARELKKPCIVGTQVATQLLQDGDTVRVDANNGIVEILS